MKIHPTEPIDIPPGWTVKTEFDVDTGKASATIFNEKNNEVKKIPCILEFEIGDRPERN